MELDKSIGTPTFVPPETDQNKKYYRESDFYTLAFVFTQIWYIKNGDDLTFTKTTGKLSNLALGCEMTYFEDSEENSIFDFFCKTYGHLIKYMTSQEPERRPTTNALRGMITLVTNEALLKLSQQHEHFNGVAEGTDQENERIEAEAKRDLRDIEAFMTGFVDAKKGLMNANEALKGYLLNINEPFFSMLERDGVDLLGFDYSDYWNGVVGTSKPIGEEVLIL